MDTTDPVGSVPPTAPSPATPIPKPACAACREVCRCTTHPVWQLRFWLCDHCARLPAPALEYLLVPMRRPLRGGRKETAAGV